jgi:Tfp pilus assembly protein PilN
MRAVNLIPTEDRRSAGAPGRTGGAVYLVLGLLAVVVLAASAYAITTNQVNQRKSDLQKTTLEADAAEAEAAAVKPYADFASLKDQRVQTVQSLASTRFDWHQLMDQFARAIPSNVWLTSFQGQTATATGTAGSASGPSVALEGCTTSHKDVARLMTRLRLIEGVNDVTLSSSQKAGAGGDGGGGDSAGCTNGHAEYPTFSMTISLDAATASTQSTTATTQPASTGSTP